MFFAINFKQIHKGDEAGEKYGIMLIWKSVREYRKERNGRFGFGS